MPGAELLAVGAEPVALVVDEGVAGRAVRRRGCGGRGRASRSGSRAGPSARAGRAGGRRSRRSGSSAGRCVSSSEARSLRASVPVGVSPPTSGSSKSSSSSRSAAATSRSRISPSSGPSGVSIAPASPAIAASVSPMSTSRRRRCSARRAASSASRSAAREVGRLEHAVEEVADVGAAGHRGERRRRRSQALLLGVGRGRRVRRRRGGKQLVVDDVDLGLGRHRLLARAGDDAAVGDPSPARVECALEACRVELDGRVRLAGPARAGRRLDPLDRDPARRLRRRAPRGVRRPRRRRACASPPRRRRRRRRARRGAGRATSCGIRYAPAHQTVAWCIVRVSAT